MKLQEFTGELPEGILLSELELANGKMLKDATGHEVQECAEWNRKRGTKIGEDANRGLQRIIQKVDKKIQELSEYIQKGRQVRLKLVASQGQDSSLDLEQKIQKEIQGIDEIIQELSERIQKMYQVQSEARRVLECEPSQYPRS